MDPSEIFVDVGFNVGFYSLLIEKLNPGIIIISIEADTFEGAEEDIKVNIYKSHFYKLGNIESQ